MWFRGWLRRVPAPLVPALLDVIAADDPNPALLQVNSAMSLMWLGTESVVVADATGAESVGLDDLLAARPDPFCAMESSWLQHIDADHDVRLPFAAPVTDVTGLGRAIRVLMGCPFLNGLRARPTL